MKINKIFLMIILIGLAAGNFAFGQENKGALASQDKITLDVKGMDVIDVLKMLASRSAMNIVVGKNVTGRVTMFLKDVDVADAFEIILLANDLAYEEKGGIINVMTQRDYELLHGERFMDKKTAKVVPLKYAKAAELSKALNQIKTNIGRIVIDEGSNTLALIDTPEKIKEMEDFIVKADLPVKTKTFSLNYAQADKLKANLEQAITKGIGSIKIDERTNKISITDYPGKLEELSQLISDFDEKSPQVLIDAQIVEIKPSDEFKMGVDWDYFIDKHFDIKANLANNTSGALFFGTPSSAVVSEAGDYKAILDVLRTIGDTKILSSPRILVMNNQEAKIHVGKRDAYVTSNISQGGTGTTVTSQSVNFVDTGIQLYVTPTINRDGNVIMKIKPEISDATRESITSEGTITEIPIVTTSEAETTIMVKDGITVVIGGLKKDTRTKTVKKIPLLGDIPGLGFLFRSTSDKMEQTDLVILLTPHIVSGEKSITELAEIQPKEGVIVEMVDGNIVRRKTAQAPQNLNPRDEIRNYYRRIVEKVQSSAVFTQPLAVKGAVKLLFTLTNDGRLAGEPQVLEAANPGLIPLAKEAVQKASPFPSFPEALDKNSETFRVNLLYK
ncbi:MAG: secretin N-terminal domain-containing protein [Candidatus Omnitrophota bacterium]